jgi:hypothetical protein
VLVRAGSLSWRPAAALGERLTPSPASPLAAFGRARCHNCPAGSSEASHEPTLSLGLKPFVHHPASIIDADRARLRAVGQRRQQLGQLGAVSRSTLWRPRRPNVYADRHGWIDALDDTGMTGTIVRGLQRERDAIHHKAV